MGDASEVRRRSWETRRAKYGERVDFISYAIRPRWADYTPLDDWFDVGEGRHADQALAILIAALTQPNGGQDQ